MNGLNPLKSENQIVATETPVFDLSFIYQASHYDELSEYLKRAKVFKKLEGLSAQAHYAAVKAAVAEILILIRMVKEFPEESRKTLSTANKSAAKYFSEFTPEQIEETIERYGLLTPAGLRLSIERAKSEQEKEIRYQEFKREAYTEDEEFALKIKAEVRDEIEDEVTLEMLEKWSNTPDDVKIRKLLESADPELSEKLTDIVKAEIHEELSASAHSKLTEIMAHPQEGIGTMLKDLRKIAENDIETYGYVGLGDLTRKHLKTRGFEAQEVAYIVIDNLSRHLRKKYDLVLSLSSTDKNNSVYIRLECATRPQIRDDVENKAAAIMADLGKFNRYYKEYIGNSDLVHALHRFSKLVLLDDAMRNEMLRNMEARNG